MAVNKIVHYIIGFHYPIRGGSENKLLNIIKMLPSAKHFIITKGGYIKFKPKDGSLNNTEIIFTGMRSEPVNLKYRNLSKEIPTTSIEYKESITNKINEINPDVLIIYGNDDNAMYIPLFSTNAKIKIVYMQAFNTRAPFELLRKADKIIIPHKKTIKLFGTGQRDIPDCISNKIEIIPGAYDDKLINTNNRQPYIGTKLLYTGRIAHIKRIRELVHFFNKYKHKASKQFTLTIIGDAFNNKYMNNVKQEISKDPSGIIMLPNMSHVELAEQYKKHDILLMPSLWETFGFSILEAFASGMLVGIASNRTIWKDLVIPVDYPDATGRDLLKDNTPEVEALMRTVLTTNIKYIDHSKDVYKYSVPEVKKLWEKLLGL